MDNFWSVLIGVAGLLVSAVGLAFIAVQVSLARRQLAENQRTQVEELRRRRMEATANAYNATLELRRTLRAVLPDDWDVEAVKQMVSRILGGDPVGEDAVKAYLGHLETFCVAVSAGVYDIEVTDSLFGPRLITIARNYRDYISARRKVSGYDGYCAELEWLAEELTSRAFSGPPYVPFAKRVRGTANAKS